MADAGGSGDVVGKSVLEVGADGTEFNAAIAGMTRKAEGFERAAVDSAGKADAAISGIGKGGGAAAQQLDRNTRSIIGSIERTVAAFKGGERGTATFFESLAKQRGANLDVLRPYIEQLRAAQDAQDETARSLAAKTAAERAAATAAAELTRAQAQQQQAQQSFIASLREQIALTGKSADEALRVRAAQLGIGSAASPLILQLQNQRAAQEQAAKAAREEADAQRQAAAAKKSAEAAGAAFINQLREQVLLQDKSRADVLRLRADKLGVGPEAEKLIAQLRGITGATRDARVEANLAKNAFRQLPAQFTDIFTSLQGGQNPFTVLIQQGGQIKDSFGGIGNAARGLVDFIGPARLAIGGVGAALGVVTIAAHKGSEELLGYERALINSGNAAGTTAGKLNEQAKAISASVGTQGKAAEVLTALAAGGNIGSAAFDKMAEAAIRLERAGGPAAEKTVEQFNELAKNPLQATLKLNEGVNFLTKSLYDQIKALEDQGRTAEAARVAQEAFTNASLSIADRLEAKLGSLQRAWRGVGDFAKGAWDAMLNVGRPDTLEEKIADAEKALDRLAKAPRRGGTRSEVVAAGGAGPVKDDLTEQVDSMKEMLRLQGRAALIEGERAALGKAQAAAGKLIEDSLARQQKLTKELAKAEQTLRDAGRLDQLPAVEAAIRKRFEEPKAKRDAFGPMLRDIEDLIRANERRVEQGRELTKAEELEISLNNKLADSLKDLSKPQQESLRIAIERAVASQRSRDAQVEEQKAAEVALKAAEKVAASRADARKKEDEGIADFIQKTREEANARVKSIRDRIAGLQAESAAITLARTRNIDLAAAIELVAIARLEEKKAQFNDSEEGAKKAKELQDEIDKRKELAKSLQDTADAKFLDDLLDPSKAKSFGDALTAAFDGAGNSLVRLSNLFEDYAQKQDKLNKGFEKNRDEDGRVKDLAIENKLIQRQGELQLSTYASMAGAAKGFFGEHTRGYKALHAAETAFQAFQLASDLVKGASAAAVGIASQAQGDPYTAFPRMAAMAAAMAALGFATGFLGKSGGGANATAEQRQSGAATGRIVTADQVNVVLGTVLGDSDAKSESIQNALELIADSADLALDYQSGMLQALRSIDASLAGLGSLVVRTAGLTTGKNLGIQTGVLSKNEGSALVRATTGFDDSVLTKNLPILGGIAKTLQGLWGKVKQEIVDSGIAILGNVNDVIVQQYADVQTTTSSFFGLKKDVAESTVLEGVEPQIAAQFGLVFESIADTLFQTAGVLGKDADQFNAAIQSFVIDIPRLSLKDLKGDELQEAINAAIGAAADNLSLTVLPGLEDFQAIGEGYFETLIKVASGIETANYQLELLGVTAIDYTAVIRKQADVGAEIVRQSIQGAETTAGVLSSVGRLIGSVDGSAGELAETYESLVDVRDVLGAIGISGDALTSSLLRGAGGLEALTDATNTYFGEFFSDEERAAAAAALLAREFAALGLAMPGSRDEFRDLVEGIDDSTDAGQKLLGQVLGLAGAFDDVADAAEKAAKDAIEAAAELARSVQQGLSQNIGNFVSPRELAGFRAGEVQSILNAPGTGISVSIEQIIGSTRDDVAALWRSVGTEGKAAILEALGAWEQFREATLAADIADIVGPLGTSADELLAAYGELVPATDNLVANWRTTTAEVNTLAAALAEIDGTQAVSAIDKLRGLITQRDGLAGVISGNNDRIFDLRVGQGGQSAVALLRQREAQLWAEFAGTNSPEVAQAITQATLQRIQLEGDLLAEANSTQLDALREQISAAERLRDVAAQMSGFVLELQAGSLSNLGYQGRLAASESLFANSLASGEDVQGNATALLQNAQSAFGGATGQYSDVFESVTGRLRGLGGQDFSGQVSDAQAQLQALEGIGDTSEAQILALGELNTRFGTGLDSLNGQIAGQTQAVREQLAELKTLQANQERQILQFGLALTELIAASKRTADAVESTADTAELEAAAP